MAAVSNGREALSWPAELWSRLDQAVMTEVDRVGIAAKVLGLRGPLPDAATVPADVVDEAMMTVSDHEVVPLVELSIEFRLTETQVEGEADLRTAVTLATRAASIIAQAEDLLIFQGDSASGGVLNRVTVRGSAGRGLVNAAASTIDVPLTSDPAGERTAKAVAHAYAELQAIGQAGPYALVVRGGLFAETFDPLRESLVMPADRIRPLMTQGFFGTATLPERTGLVLSTGGATMDLVVGVEPVVAFLQVDGSGLYHFRLFERFAPRLKDPTALVRLEFEH
jgi:uncharacterized linocin/CFP29 family protein